MNQLFLPVAYFPTTRVCIDDDLDTLKTIERMIGPNYSVNSYANPKEGLQALLTKHHISPLYERYFKGQFDPHAPLLPFYQLLNESNRFLVSVMAYIDYNMPGVDGLSVCRELKDKVPWLNRILLTGEAEDKQAIQAFNENLIQAFFLKGTAETDQQVADSASTVPFQQFCALSQASVACLVRSCPDTAIVDPAFIDLFQSLCKQHDIVEYYLLHAEGDYVLVDRAGKLFWLAVFTDEQLDVFLDDAEEDDVPDVVTVLQSRTQAPCLLLPEQQKMLPMPSEWQVYLRPIQAVPNSDNRYYAFFQDDTQYRLPMMSFVSFDAFRK